QHVSQRTTGNHAEASGLYGSSIYRLIKLLPTIIKVLTLSHGAINKKKVIMETATTPQTKTTAPEVKEISGSVAVLEALIAEGVDTIFGYPGGAIMPIYDALYDYNDKIKHILVRHEQGGIHAAQGYARASGKVGVAFATSGPGATNLVTGLADAQIDSTPIVCITGQVFAHLLGTDAFQETDVI